MRKKRKAVKPKAPAPGPVFKRPQTPKEIEVALAGSLGGRQCPHCSQDMPPSESWAIDVKRGRAPLAVFGWMRKADEKNTKMGALSLLLLQPYDHYLDSLAVLNVMDLVGLLREIDTVHATR